MNSKTKTMLDKYVKEENLHKLKASEIKEIKKSQEVYVGFGCFTYLTLFFLVVSVVAVLIWNTKLTLFISIVMLLINLPMVYLSVSSYKSITKRANEIAKRVNNNE